MQKTTDCIEEEEAERARGKVERKWSRNNRECHQHLNQAGPKKTNSKSLMENRNPTELKRTMHTGRDHLCASEIDDLSQAQWRTKRL